MSGKNLMGIAYAVAIVLVALWIYHHSFGKG